MLPSLQRVTNVTKYTCLTVLGSERAPLAAGAGSLALSLAAGVGEEIMFRGVLQQSLSAAVGEAPGLVLASAVFGALHAVTPTYALLAVGVDPTPLLSPTSLSATFFGNPRNYVSGAGRPLLRAIVQYVRSFRGRSSNSSHSL